MGMFSKGRNWTWVFSIWLSHAETNVVHLVLQQKVAGPQGQACWVDDWKKDIRARRPSLYHEPNAKRSSRIDRCVCFVNAKGIPGMRATVIGHHYGKSAIGRTELA